MVIPWRRQPLHIIKELNLTYRLQQPYGLRTASGRVRHVAGRPIDHDRTPRILVGEHHHGKKAEFVARMILLNAQPETL
jgi:hypothetical protein